MHNPKYIQILENNFKKTINLEFNFNCLVILRNSKQLNCLQKFASFFEAKVNSMTTLLTHTVAHSTKPSFMPKTNNQPLKKFLSLALS